MLWFVYIALVGFHIFSILQGNSTWIMISKPLLMPTLIGIVFLQTQLKSTLSKILSVGLLLGWLGDIFLMFNSTLLFGLGLLSFLLGHIVYMVLFSKEVSTRKQTHLLMESPHWILPFLVFWIFTITLFSGKTAPFPAFPIYLYAFVISLMSIYAINRWHAVDRSSWLLVLLGSLLFIFSDLSIGVAKFISNFSYDRTLIMSSYTAAQALIVAGVLKSLKK